VNPYSDNLINQGRRLLATSLSFRIFRNELNPSVKDVVVVVQRASISEGYNQGPGETFRYWDPPTDLIDDTNILTYIQIPLLLLIV
jgi:hypothetical protein